MKSLVVVYSRTGSTRTAGQTIAASLGGDFDLVISSAPRHGPLGFLRSSWEATFGVHAQIAHPARKVVDYDLVVVGSPIWNSSVSSPVRSYLHQNRELLRAIAFFVTGAGVGADRALLEMQQIAGRAPIATLEIRGAISETTVGNFTQRLGAAFSPIRTPSVRQMRAGTS